MDGLLKVGGASHSFSRFSEAVLGFLSTQMMTQQPQTNQIPTTTNVRGVCHESRADLQKAGPDAPNATVVATLCAVESNGTAIRNGEAMTLTNGQFQMSVEVEDWQWCGCGQEEGRFLEFNLTVAVPEGYKISANNNTASNMPVKIYLGPADAFIMVSMKVSKQICIISATHLTGGRRYVDNSLMLYRHVIYMLFRILNVVHSQWG